MIIYSGRFWLIKLSKASHDKRLENAETEQI
jgi:hypothetical protein